MRVTRNRPRLGSRIVARRSRRGIAARSPRQCGGCHQAPNPMRRRRLRPSRRGCHRRSRCGRSGPFSRPVPRRGPPPLTRSRATALRPRRVRSRPDPSIFRIRIGRPAPQSCMSPKPPARSRKFARCPSNGPLRREARMARVPIEPVGRHFEHAQMRILQPLPLCWHAESAFASADALSSSDHPNVRRPAAS